MKLVWFFLAAASIYVNSANGLQCYRCDSQTDTSDVHCEKGLNIPTENCNPTEQCYKGSYKIQKEEKSFNIYIRGCGPVIGGCKAEASKEQSKRLSFRLTQLSCDDCDKELCNSANSPQYNSGNKLMFATLFIQLLFIINKFV